MKDKEENNLAVKHSEYLGLLQCIEESGEPRKDIKFSDHADEHGFTEPRIHHQGMHFPSNLVKSERNPSFPTLHGFARLVSHLVSSPLKQKKLPKSWRQIPTKQPVLTTVKRPVIKPMIKPTRPVIKPMIKPMNRQPAKVNPS